MQVRHATGSRSVWGGDRPTLQCLLSTLGQLKRARERIAFIPLLAEVIGVDAERRAIRMFVWEVRYDRFAQKLSRHELVVLLYVPSLVERDVQVEAIMLFDQLNRGIPIRLEERSAFMRGRLGALQEDIALHPDGQTRRIVFAQIAVFDEQVVVEAVI